MREAWHGWYSLGGNNQMKGTVAVTYLDGTVVDLYQRDIYDQLWQKGWDGRYWSPSDDGWTLHEDSFHLGSSPTVFSLGSYRDIYVRGCNGEVFRKFWDGKNWNGWYGLGGAIQGSVGVTYPTPNTIDLYVRGMNNELYQKSWDGSRWWPSDLGWMPHDDGFRLNSSPVVYSLGANHRDIYVLGVDGNIYHKYWTSDYRFGTARVLAKPSKSAQVDALFAPVVNNSTPGAAVIVVKNGQVAHAAGYGLADINNHKPITPKTMFHFASAAKQQTALGIMMLKQEGRIAYDDPVGKHLPELARFGSKFTIRRLLHHTSGIPDYYEGEGYKKLLAIVSNPGNFDALKLLSTWGDLHFSPGDKSEYSNVGYDMLSCLIERKLGQTYAWFMWERVFNPLGMPNSFSLPNPRVNDPDRAIPYTIQANGSFKAEGASALDRITGSGSIYTSVLDLYPYVQALRKNALVSQATYAEAFVPRKLNNGTVEGYGFGWWLQNWNGESYVWHQGGWCGYTADFSIFPNRDLYIITLANRTDLDLEGIPYGIASIYW